MKNRLAVIDLGTNTFNILIAEATDNDGFEQVVRERIHVHLASDGIGNISEAAFERGLRAMQYFATVLKTNEVQKVNAIGTAALRTAANGKDFIAKVKASTDIQIQLIDGEQEAELIYEGVTRAYPLGKKFDLIMDIGGGSVEFIVANQAEVIWKQSFPVGVAVLRKNFHQIEPMHITEIDALHIFLTKALEPLFEVLQQYPIDKLIGASGTFDVLENIFAKEKTNPLYAAIAVSDAEGFYQSVKDKTLDERKNMSTVPEERATMIVVAMILVLFVTQRAKVNTIISSAYAVKEGILGRMIGKKAPIRFL
jgi:exopolyphosphatase / guanosine-5'-triphosphate,3'-diphosphate pyrophosphatase